MVIVAVALIFRFSSFVGSFFFRFSLAHTHTLSFEWLTTYVHSSHAIRLNELLLEDQCCVIGANGSIFFSHVFLQPFFAPRFSFSISIVFSYTQRRTCIHALSFFQPLSFHDKNTNSIHCEKLKIFTNKQQIKIWQKCFQIIICSVKESEASYETSIGKE